MFAAAAFACAILAALGAIHLYWAAGGSVGKDGAIPSVDGKPVFSPGSAGTALVGIALFVAAGLITTSVSPIPFKVAAGLLAFIFCARAVGDFNYVGFFKRVKGSRFARQDTYLYSPLCVILAASIGVVVF
jgi:hypothetical protein